MRTYEEECAVLDRIITRLQLREKEQEWECVLDAGHKGTMPLDIPKSTWMPRENCGVMQIPQLPEDEQNRSFEDSFN